MPILWRKFIPTILGNLPRTRQRAGHFLLRQYVVAAVYYPISVVHVNL